MGKHFEPAGYAGDYRPGDLIVIPFNSFGVAGGLCEVDNGITHPIFCVRGSDGTSTEDGLVIAIDVMGTAGVNLAVIDTSANAPFYNEADHFLVLAGDILASTEGITVTGELLGSFSLGVSSALMPVTRRRKLSVDSANLALNDTRKVNGTAVQASGGFHLLPNGTATGQLKLNAGYVAMDWGDIANVGATVGFSGTSIKTATEVRTVVDAIEAKTDGLPTYPSRGVKRAVAFDAYPVLMVLSSDHRTPATGVVVTAERSRDGAAFAACTNAPVEVGHGLYILALSATDLTANFCVAVRFTAPGCDDVVSFVLITP